MDYKKKYEDALERARKLSQSISGAQYDKIFPELNESEDEKIRKAIHIYLDWLDGRNKDYQPKGDYSIKDMIAWLEKQGEKKSQRMISAEAKEAMYDKPTWSEDEVKINRIVACLENLNVADNDILLKDIDWLKSLKERIE